MIPARITLLLGVCVYVEGVKAEERGDGEKVGPDWGFVGPIPPEVAGSWPESILTLSSN